MRHILTSDGFLAGLLVGIRADLNISWMVSTCPLLCHSSSPWTNHSLTVPKAQITIGITDTFMFQSLFFQFPRKVQLVIFLLAFFQFYNEVSRDRKIHNSASYIFFFCWLLFGLVVWPRLSDPFVSQNPRVSFSRTDLGLCIHDLFMWSTFSFLHNSVDHLAHAVVSNHILFLC